jgi:hypothetical protein
MVFLCLPAEAAFDYRDAATISRTVRRSRQTVRKLLALMA